MFSVILKRLNYHFIKIFFVYSDEFLEQEVKFLTDKSLEEVLQSYVDKTEVFASFVDKKQWYRIVVRDTECRLVKIFKA